MGKAVKAASHPVHDDFANARDGLVALNLGHRQILVSRSSKRLEVAAHGAVAHCATSQFYAPTTYLNLMPLRKLIATAQTELNPAALGPV